MLAIPDKIRHAIVDRMSSGGLELNIRQVIVNMIQDDIQEDRNHM